MDTQPTLDTLNHFRRIIHSPERINTQEESKKGRLMNLKEKYYNTYRGTQSKYLQTHTPPYRFEILIKNKDYSTVEHNLA